MYRSLYYDNVNVAKPNLIDTSFRSYSYVAFVVLHRNSIVSPFSNSRFSVKFASVELVVVLSVPNGDQFL